MTGIEYLDPEELPIVPEVQVDLTRDLARIYSDCSTYLADADICKVDVGSINRLVVFDPHVARLPPMSLKARNDIEDPLHSGTGDPECL